MENEKIFNSNINNSFLKQKFIRSIKNLSMVLFLFFTSLKRFSAVETNCEALTKVVLEHRLRLN